jgi:hypothetical protein
MGVTIMDKIYKILNIIDNKIRFDSSVRNQRDMRLREGGVKK